MTDQNYDAGGRVTFRDLYGAIRDSREENSRCLDELKADQRRDLQAMEGRLLDAFNNLREEFRTLREDTRTQVKDLDTQGSAALEAHIEATRLADAKMAGRVEVLSKAGLFVAKNWKWLAALVIAIVASSLGFDLSGIEHAVGLP